MLRAVEPLIAALKDENPSVRATAAYSLIPFKDARSVEPLVATLNDPDSSVRRSAVEALGKIKDLRSLDPLLLLGDREKELRIDIRVALRNFGEEAMPALLEALDRRHYVYLKKDQRRREMDYLKRQRLGEYVRSPLSDQDTYKKHTLLEKVCLDLGEKNINPLLDALNHQYHGVRECAAFLLESLNWQASNPYQRALCAVLTGRYEDAVKEGSAALDPLLAEFKRWPNKDVIAAFEKIGDTRAIEPLKAYALSNVASKSLLDSDVRMYAARTLCNISPLDAVKPLLFLVSTSEEFKVDDHQVELIKERVSGANFHLCWVIKNFASKLPEDELRAITNLKDRTFYREKILWRTEYQEGRDLEKLFIDCSQTRQLAQQELSIRGLGDQPTTLAPKNPDKRADGVIRNGGELYTKMKKVISDELCVSEEEITLEARFLGDLSTDSFDLIELSMRAEEELDIEILDEEVERLRTVGDAYEYLKKKLGIQ